MEMKIIITVIYMRICVVNVHVGELNESTNCPLTKDEWTRRAKEVCKSQPENYQCMYNISCKIEEFCDEEERNNFQIYLREDPIFFKKEQNYMNTKSMDYWKIQDILYCNNTTWQPSTTGDNQENVIYKTVTPVHCYVCWAVSAIAISVVIILIYIINRNENKEKTDDKVNLSTVVMEATPVSGRTERIPVGSGNAGTLQGRNESYDPQHSSLMKGHVLVYH